MSVAGEKMHEMSQIIQMSWSGRPSSMICRAHPKPRQMMTATKGRPAISRTESRKDGYWSRSRCVWRPWSTWALRASRRPQRLSVMKPGGDDGWWWSGDARSCWGTAGSRISVAWRQICSAQPAAPPATINSTETRFFGFFLTDDSVECRFTKRGIQIEQAFGC